MIDPVTSGALRGGDGAPPADEGTLPLSSPILQRLFEREAARLLPALQTRDFEPHALLIAPGEPPAGLFVIVSGEVAVSRRSAGHAFLPVEVLRRGDVLALRSTGHGAVTSGAHQPIHARAVTRTSTRLLPRARLEALAAEVPDLAAALAAFASAQASRRGFLAAMRRSPAFRHASPRRLTALFDAAEPVPASPGDVLVAQGDRPTGFYFVVDGELAETQARGGDGSALVHTLAAGDLFGEQAIAAGAEPATVIATRPTRLLRVPAERYEALLGASSALRRSVGQVAPGSIEPARGRPGTVEVLLLQSDIPGAPIGVLTDLLARTLATDHGDRVAVLELTSHAPGGASPLSAPMSLLAGLTRYAVPTPDGPGAAPAVEEALLALDGAYDQVFLDTGGRGEALAAALAPVLSERDGRRERGRLVARGKVVFLSRDPLAQRLPPALRAVPVASAALLSGREPPPMPPASAWSPTRLLRAAPRAAAARARAYPSATARLRLDLGHLAGLRRADDRRISGLQPATRETLSRWGRAITDRSVGVALGGGGAWGFAHVTLLRRIAEAGVPIDMVSGASFGALAGAFFCAAGIPGLDLLVEQSGRANVASSLCFITSTAIADFVDLSLGDRRLEDLEIPLFPVATELASGTEHVLSVGTLGQGVRASGAFPGMFTPVTGDDGRFVDGCFINNVPASVLVLEGADLIVASNIVGAPTPLSPGRPLLRGRLGRFLHEMNPVARSLDLIRAGFVMMHATGGRESEFADVVFESDPIELPPHERGSLRDRIFQGRVPFWDFTVAREVAAQAEPKVEATVELIRARWEQLSRGPRGGWPGGPPSMSPWSAAAPGRP